MENLIRRFFNWVSDDGSGRGVCHYDGPYGNGRAYYEYVEMDGKRVYEGIFSYCHKYADCNGGKALTRAAGRFSDGRKTGRWMYECRDAGLTRRLWVDYADGRPHGRYRYVETAPGRMLWLGGRTVSRIDAGFVGGCASEEVSGLIRGMKFVGFLDAQGRPAGLWKMECGIKCYRESWRDGVCAEVSVMDKSTGDRQQTDVQVTSVLESVVHYDCVPLELIGRTDRKSAAEQCAGTAMSRRLRDGTP